MKPRIPPVLITFAFLCFALVQNMQAVSPSPDGGYPGGNTAEGQNALLSLTSGGFNTAVGFFSLKNNTTGGLNTAIGAGALLANTGGQNTATGAGALSSNTTHGSIGGYKSPFPIPETQSDFHRHAQRNAFHRRGVRQQSRSFAPQNQGLIHSPNSNQPAEIVGDYFPILQH
jgi:hypothetical protein